MICPKCLEDFKNLGAHKRFCKVGGEIIIDEYLGESLSSIVANIREVLKAVKYELEIKTVEENGKEYKSLELNIRIPIRR